MSKKWFLARTSFTMWNVVKPCRNSHSIENFQMQFKFCIYLPLSREMYPFDNKNSVITMLQIRRGNRDNLGISSHFLPLKHIL